MTVIYVLFLAFLKSNFTSGSMTDCVEDQSSHAVMLLVNFKKAQTNHMQEIFIDWYPNIFTNDCNDD